MVDLAEIQAAYYMIAATGVLIAAIYYVLNMRATLETRRIGLIDSIMSRTINKDGFRSYFELMNYDWRDYGDFERKYGSDNDVVAAATRFENWHSYNSIGTMIRKGMVRAEDLYDMGMFGVTFIWEKYKPIIEENRRRYNGKDHLRDLEYLADEMMRVKLVRDPSYKMPETFIKYIPDE